MVALPLKLVLLALASLAAAHDMGLPVNPALGVPGFPDCRNPRVEAGEVMTSLLEADAALVCGQRAAPNDAIRVGTIGDSITAGVHSSGERQPEHCSAGFCSLPTPSRPIRIVLPHAQLLIRP